MPTHNAKGLQNCILLIKFILKFDNNNENRLEKTCICEKETYLNFTMTMEHVVAYGVDKRRGS